MNSKIPSWFQFRNLLVAIVNKAAVLPIAIDDDFKNCGLFYFFQGVDSNEYTPRYALLQGTYNY